MRGYQIQAVGLGIAAFSGVRMVDRAPKPEKYAGQREAFRRGAWPGDGVPPDPARSKGRKCRQA